MNGTVWFDLGRALIGGRRLVTAGDAELASARFAAEDLRSGHGRGNGFEALREFTRLRTVAHGAADRARRDRSGTNPAAAG